MPWTASVESGGGGEAGFAGLGAEARGGRGVAVLTAAAATSLVRDRSRVAADDRDRPVRRDRRPGPPRPPPPGPPRLVCGWNLRWG